MRPKPRPKTTIDRRDLAGLVIALLIAATCIRLGVWQLDRLHARRERNALLLVARARPPLEVNGSLPADSARDRRLRAHGVYDYRHERLWRARSYQGVPGVDLVTPLRLVDGAAVLVDRGWAPSPDATATPATLPGEAGPVTRRIAGTRRAIVMAALANSDLRRSFSLINMICGTLLAY